MKINETEMNKLIVYLCKNVDGDRDGHMVFTRPLMTGLQVIVCDAGGNWLWDAVCHQHSYGGNQGLIEIMEQSKENYILTEEERECDDVLGYLTAEDIIKRLES